MNANLLASPSVKSVSTEPTTSDTSRGDVLGGSGRPIASAEEGLPVTSAGDELQQPIVVCVFPPTPLDQSANERGALVPNAYHSAVGVREEGDGAHAYHRSLFASATARVARMNVEGQRSPSCRIMPN